VRSYPTTSGADLLHADLYRLQQLREVIDLGLPEQLEEGAFAVVEWGERGVPALLPEYLSVTLESGGDENQRRLRLEAVGPAWLERWPEMVAALSALGNGAGMDGIAGDSAPRTADRAAS
jgi:tRNA A37 threonylcarbamoyladenosine biosynthesis protein TsaE